MKRFWVVFTLLFVGGIFFSGCAQKRPQVRLLIFSKTAGFRHQPAIEAGQAAILKLAHDNGFAADTTENAAYFHEDSLRQYSAVIFLNTTGDVLDAYQQADFVRYIQAGGGYVGVHSASDTEYDWPWYGRLVGAFFQDHPQIQQATIRVIDKTHGSTKRLNDTWTRTDEWYNFRPESLNPNVNVLLALDESSYQGGTMGDNHPIAWNHEYDGGRAFYTGLGHTPETYKETDFLWHLLGGIMYAVGPNEESNFSNVSQRRVPEPDRFRQVVLDEFLNEPMELEVLPNGDVLFVERGGVVKLYEKQREQTRTVATLSVNTKFEDGLLGVALDPDYANNQWIYLFYSSPGNNPVQHVSRFEFDGDDLAMDTEKILIEIPVQRDECCHAGGSLEFDASGNLYISTGDNTNPFFSDGYAPIDETPGRRPFDAQRSAANSNDLRGKILRIHPEPNGTYTIPDGNLFPVGSGEGRPEVYVMGCRNPFRISIDPVSGYLYWGDVGPDAATDSLGRGPKGHDELNQARGPGFFGWPYFIGDNKPYHRYNFETRVSGNAFIPAEPINRSPNNTGTTKLPPAQPAFVWYPYSESPEFPAVGTGGRTAMAGPFYQSEKYPDSPVAFPSYFDNKVLFYDWIRDWMFMISVDENGDFEEMERFLPELDLHNPIDMVYGPDGALYILEYGTTWNAKNTDARLSRIEFNSGNRLPKIQLAANKVQGATPLTIQFSTDGTYDPDKDGLQFTWKFDRDQVQARGPSPSYTFRNSGEYRVALEVSDSNGGVARSFLDVLVGNDPPRVEWVTDANRSFYWSYQPIIYEVVASDREDGEIDPALVRVTLEYDPSAAVSTGVSSELAYDSKLAVEGLLETHNCRSCHRTEGVSQGPAYTDVAQKYAEQTGAEAFLVRKVINGGAGVWGETTMPAHPNLREADAARMVRFILSTAKPKAAATPLPAKGAIRLRNHVWSDTRGTYQLTATYTDFGAGNIRPIASSSVLFLRNPRLELENYLEASRPLTRITSGEEELLGSVTDGTWIRLGYFDLSGIGFARLRILPPGAGRVELRLDSPDGVLAATAQLGERELNGLTLTGANGFHEVYLVFEANEGAAEVARPDYLEFVR